MRVPKITKMPPALRREIEERLVASGYGDYGALEADLRRRGWNIGKSSLHRWGQKLKAIQLAADAEALKARARARARKAAA